MPDMGGQVTGAAVAVVVDDNNVVHVPVERGVVRVDVRCLQGMQPPQFLLSFHAHTQATREPSALQLKEREE